MATRWDRPVFRGRDKKFSLTYDEDITNYTVAATASDGTTDFDATITKSIPNKTWTILWTDAQTALMTSESYKYDVKITDGDGVDYNAYYGTFTMKNSVT